jgi:protein-L-isoaspartate O-methyltransferase
MRSKPLDCRGDHPTDTELRSTTQISPSTAKYAVPWVARVATLAGRELVEIGCGTGWSTAAFARLAGYVHAYDIDPPFVDGAVTRARVLRLTNVAFHAVPAVQLLAEIRRRHQANSVDLVLLFALLEHCTTVECLDTIRTS